MDNSYVLDDVMTLNINSMDFKWIINDSKSIIEKLYEVKLTVVKLNFVRSMIAL